MKLEITEEAYQDLENVRDYIEKDSIEAAQKVARIILLHTNNQLAVPAHGRAGLVPDTLELKVPKLPYIVVYRIKGDSYQILRIFHDRQFRTKII
jgi:toxin ParE1/3/4